MIQPHAYPHSRLLVLLSLLFLSLVGFGIALAQMEAYEGDVIRQQILVAGAVPTPVLHLRPLHGQGSTIAIVVHGYSGSKEVMLGFGIELARMGVPSYLLDLPGHGASTVPLDEDALDGDAPQLQAALDAVISYALRQSDVPHPTLVLVGHSLGARVVGQYAATHQTDTLLATIMISPTLAIAPTTTHPANVLYLVGEDDLAGIRDLARKDMVAGCGLTNVAQVATTYQQCGVPAQKTGRQLVVIAGANHISILADAATLQAMDDWVAATAHLQPVAVASNIRLFWTIFGCICVVMATAPLMLLATWGFGFVANTAPQASPARASLRALWVRFGVTAVGVGITLILLRGWSLIFDALGMPEMHTPLSWMHMALADDVGSFNLVAGLVLWAGWWAGHRRRLNLPWQRIWAQVALGFVVALAFAALLGTLVTREWDDLLLDAPRFWRFIVLVIVSFPVFAFVEVLFDQRDLVSLWREAGVRLGALLLLPLGLVGMIVLDHTLLFLFLLIPLYIVLCVAFAGLVTALRHRSTTTAFAASTFMSLIFAWLVAAIFPIIQ